MKAIFITYDQAHHEDVVQVLNTSNQRGYTHWPNIQGRGSLKGEPHFGSHAWPATNAAIMTITPKEKVDTILERLATLNKSKEKLGLRAFVLPVEKSI